MARSLASKPNVDAPGGNYPYGRVRNNPGDNTGTNADENLFGDLIQFFERLMALGGVSANGQPENSSSGFQYVTALLNTVLNTIGMGASNAIDYSGNLFSLTQPGHYFAELAASNKPVATTGDVIFFKMSVNEQFLIFLSSNGKFYYNTKTGGSWLGWICLNDVASNKVDKGGDSMSGVLAMGGNKITGLAAATANGDALRYEQVTGLYLLLTGGSLSGALGMGANKITNLGAGTNPSDAIRLDQIAPGAWVNIPVTGSSWANHIGTLKYRIDAAGQVHISGNIQVTTYSTPIFATTPAALASMASVINGLEFPMPPIAGGGEPYLFINATQMGIGVNSGSLINGSIGIFNGISFWPDENS